uniref:MATH domain-containing protein n=1 Tax=Kalanchoe fedtschenkoi TaxID=63787 RepID=A0A7N1A2G8_KALFE
MSFSDLSDILRQKPGGAERYESPQFESGGHKWKLSLYPNGDAQSGGDGHISLYLNMVEAADHSYGSGVGVTYKMLVWDRIRDERCGIEPHPTMRKFHSLKKRWGFTRLMSLATFKDAQSGYLVDDCCLFGIEMNVVSPDVQLRSLSIVKEPDHGTFKWKLDKFSTLGEESYDSDPFMVEAQQWNLCVFPNGDSRQKGSCLSLFLSAHDVKCHGGSKVYVDATLRLKDQHFSKDHEISLRRWFHGSGRWGWPAFVLLTDLKDKARGFLMDDSLVLEVTFNAISTISYTKAE